MLRLLLVTVIVRRGREGRRESNGDKELKKQNKNKNRTKQDKRGDFLVFHSSKTIHLTLTTNYIIDICYIYCSLILSSIQFCTEANSSNSSRMTSLSGGGKSSRVPPCPN